MHTSVIIPALNEAGNIEITIVALNTQPVDEIQSADGGMSDRMAMNARSLGRRSAKKTKRNEYSVDLRLRISD
jgi:hypothetical protein